VIPNFQLSADGLATNEFTAKGKSIGTIEPFIVREQCCQPNQMIDWKPMIHKLDFRNAKF
jgi:hypothetical protein